MGKNKIILQLLDKMGTFFFWFPKWEFFSPFGHSETNILFLALLNHGELLDEHH